MVSSWTIAFVFVGCRYNDCPAVIVPYIPLDNVSVCVSVFVSSGLQSSKGSVFPVTVLWQKHLHTVTRSDQPKQLSAGKSYRKNVYAPPEHISQTPATWIKLAVTHKSVLFFFSRLIKFFLICICMALSIVLSSVIVMKDADLWISSCSVKETLSS